MDCICKRCIGTEHVDGKSIVTKLEQFLGKCSYCGVENWIFEVVGDVPAKTIADMPELEVEKLKKRKEREVGESIPLTTEEAKEVIRNGESITKVLDAAQAELDNIELVKKEPVEKSLDDMTEDELRAKLAELEKK